jgi:AraC-like DNA-binding protein
VLLNYESQIKIKDIAEKLHISEAHLMRQFKKETGYTITYLVNQKRIEKAKHVLKYSGESVLDVAYSIGYRDPSYFARVFKKLVGVSPKNYRQKQTLLSD